MAPPMRLAALALALAPVSDAFRSRRKSKANVSAQSTGKRGEIHGVYSFGAPAMASPYFVNPASPDGCFPGLRTWLASPGVVGHYTDAVPMALGILGFRHPLQEGWRIDTKKEEGESYPCTKKWAEGPSGIPSIALHDGLAYLDMGVRVTPSWVSEVAKIGLNHSYEKDPVEAAAMIKPLGWNLVGYALHPGGTAIGGPQPSLLLQHPQSLKCIVTFQGTATIKDWLSNLQADKVHFCGFTETDESCPETGSVCEVRNPGGAFVHEGFRNHWRRIIQHEQWQNNIRPLLSSCAEVHATGHSLGGVLSELLAGCAAKKLNEGDYGWYDAQWITWTQGTPRKLPERYAR